MPLHSTVPQHICVPLLQALERSAAVQTSIDPFVRVCRNPLLWWSRAGGSSLEETYRIPLGFWGLSCQPGPTLEKSRRQAWAMRLAAMSGLRELCLARLAPIPRQHVNGSTGRGAPRPQEGPQRLAHQWPVRSAQGGGRCSMTVERSSRFQPRVSESPSSP